MKASKVRRKIINEGRQMGDVPWPARRFKYPPTFGNRRTYAAMTPRRRARAEKAILRLQAQVAQATAELQRKQEESRAQANRKRRGLFRKGGNRESFVGRIFSRRKV